MRALGGVGADSDARQGGDVSVIYESNWDLWQQWQNEVTLKIPYMVLPGNHEASCAEFDGPGNVLTAYLNSNQTNSTAPQSDLTYWSCPPSQRNFTTYQHRFRMPGNESGGVSNFWYSFDYGLAHFVSIDGETDFAYSPEWPFLRDTGGKGNQPAENQTYSTDSGPFGAIDDAQWKNNSAYQQVQWLARDLAAVDRTKTPWIIAMSHRPMYSSEVSSYQANVRAAFQAILLRAGVDMYLAGHIHWYERNWPITANGTVDRTAVRDNHTYTTNPGVSLTHITNGMAGNIESHSFLANGSKILNTTAVLNQQDYGFSKLTFHNASALSWEFVKGDGSGVGDSLTLLKKGATGVAPSGPKSSSSAAKSVSASAVKSSSAVKSASASKASVTTATKSSSSSTTSHAATTSSSSSSSSTTSHAATTSHSSTTSHATSSPSSTVPGFVRPTNWGPPSWGPPQGGDNGNGNGNNGGWWWFW